MVSEENSGYNDARRRNVYQSMDQPLTHYYIASSHNTYIESHQLKVGGERGRERGEGERGREGEGREGERDMGEGDGRGRWERGMGEGDGRGSY